MTTLNEICTTHQLAAITKIARKHGGKDSWHVYPECRGVVELVARRGRKTVFHAYIGTRGKLTETINAL